MIFNHGCKNSITTASWPQYHHSSKVGKIHKKLKHNNGDLPEKYDPRTPPFKVNRTNTDRSDFLLVINSNHLPILCHFQDKWQLPLKSANFFLPPVFNTPMKSFPWNSVMVMGFKRLDKCPYQNVRKCNDTCSMHLFRHNTGIGWMDRQTDRQTDINSKTISRSSCSAC